MGSREEAPTGELECANAETETRPKGGQEAVTWAQDTTLGRNGVESPDVTNKNTRCPVTLEFQINKK